MPSLRVTSMGSPTRRQPWRTPMPSGRVGGDGGGHRRRRAAPRRRGTGRCPHAQVVAGAAADEGDLGADDPVGAPHDLRLVAGEPVGEEQQDPVWPCRRSRSRQAATSAPASRSRPPAASAAAVATSKPGPPRAVTTTPASPGPAVEISPAVEQPIIGVSPATSLMPGHELGQVVGLAAEHDEELGVGAGEGLGGGVPAGGARLRRRRTGLRPASAPPRRSGKRVQGSPCSSAATAGRHEGRSRLAPAGVAPDCRVWAALAVGTESGAAAPGGHEVPGEVGPAGRRHGRPPGFDDGPLRLGVRHGSRANCSPGDPVELGQRRAADEGHAVPVAAPVDQPGGFRRPAGSAPSGRVERRRRTPGGRPPRRCGGRCCPAARRLGMRSISSSSSTPARPQRPDERGEHLVPLGDVDEHRPGVDQVERRLGQAVDHHVVAAHLEVRRRESGQQRRFEIHGQRPARPARPGRRASGPPTRAPAPTSRQCHPAPTPSWSRWRRGDRIAAHLQRAPAAPGPPATGCPACRPACTRRPWPSRSPSRLRTLGGPSHR